MQLFRRYMNCCLLFSLFTVPLPAPAATSFSGVVVADDEDNTPVPDVLVGAGYSEYRTLTDGDGRFSLELPENSVRRPTTRRRSGKIHVSFRRQNVVIDFSHAPGVSTAALYRLNGSCLLRKQLSKYGHRLVVPSPAPGCYILTVSNGSNAFRSYRIMNYASPSHRYLACPRVLHAPHATAEGSGSIPLIFRHDGFFPHDTSFSESADDCVITLEHDARSFVFDETKIHTYRFSLTPEDSLSMEVNARAEEYVAAHFTFDSIPYGTVGLRYKGSDYYAMPRCFDEEGNRADFPECENVSLKVKFDKYVDSTRFFNMKRLNLHSMSADETKLREILSYALFRDAGVYTCRTAFARVYVNDVYRGLFTAVEAIDGRFTKSRWTEFGDGNLYKEAWPFKVNRAYYREHLKTNDNPEDSADVTPMADFYRTIRESTPETFIADLSSRMDFNYWLRYFVVDRAIHNSDGIMTWYVDGSWMGNHNYFIYEEENPGGRFWLIPWDLNVTLYESEPMVDDYGLPEWNEVPDSCGPVTVWGGSQAIPPNCDPLTGLMAEVLWDQFVLLGEAFLSTTFDTLRTQEKIDGFISLIEPELEDDPHVDVDKWRRAAARLRNVTGTLYRGFDDYIHGRVPEIDTSGFFTPFPDDSLLLTDRVNNFEFTGAVDVDSLVTAFITPESEITIELDTASPLWGTADLLTTFVFNPADTTRTYTEWIMLHIPFGEVNDLSDLQGVRISMQADAARYCRVTLESEAYGDDMSYQYGWTCIIGVNNKQFAFETRSIDYPDWAEGETPDVLDSVLTTCTGIRIMPEAQFDSNGQLQMVPDSGFVRIDNIIFEW